EAADGPVRHPAHAESAELFRHAPGGELARPLLPDERDEVAVGEEHLPEWPFGLGSAANVDDQWGEAKVAQIAGVNRSVMASPGGDEAVTGPNHRQISQPRM